MLLNLAPCRERECATKERQRQRSQNSYNMSDPPQTVDLGAYVFPLSLKQDTGPHVFTFNRRVSGETQRRSLFAT